KSGDTIFIDAYRIAVSIEKPPADEKKKDDPFEMLKARSKEDRANLTVALPPRVEEDRTAAMSRTNEEASVEWIGIDMDDDEEDEIEDEDEPAAAAPPPPQPAKRAAPPAPEPKPAPVPAPAPSRPVATPAAAKTPAAPLAEGD